MAQINITDNSTMQFEATIVGRDSIGQKHCSYKITGVIDKTGGSAAIINNVNETIIAESEESWVSTVLIDNQALRVRCTGEAATTIRWTASIYTAEMEY